VQAFIDTEGRLRIGDDLAHASAADVFGPALRDICPFDIDLGYCKARDHRRLWSQPQREFLTMDGTWTLRLSVPGLVFEGSRIRFVVDGGEYTDEIDLATLNRHQVETILNDTTAITNHGGVTVEGNRTSRGTVYRVQFIELGTAPTLRWEITNGPQSIEACQAPAEDTGNGGRILYDIWIPDTPSLEWVLSDQDPAEAIEVTPLGPSFGTAGVQIDRVTIHPHASGHYCLRVTGDDPTEPIPVSASAAEVLDAVRAVSPGVYSTARWAGNGIIDLVHQVSGIQPVITSNDVFSTMPAIKTATIAHGGLVADNLAGGKRPVQMDIIRERSTEVNGLASPTIETIYTATL
jgi:hypothetical protein